MKINGQKITITQGDSFSVTFKLVAEDDTDALSEFVAEDKIVWVLNPYGEQHPLLIKEQTGITGTEVTIDVINEESKVIPDGHYEYGLFVINGTTRTTLVKPTSFTIERGV